MNLSTRDRHLIWHPFTQQKTAPPVLAIKKASGAYLYDENGKAYLDLIASWWVNLHGHAHPAIAESIFEQAKTLEHVLFAGFTHEPAVELCEGLQALLPPSLNKFLFSDNGSTAVEVALKMAYQYGLNSNENPKKIFLSFEGGYHGDTFGAMAVGQKSGFHNQFNDLFFKVLSIPYPDTWDGDKDVESKEAQSILILDQILDEFGPQIAAMIMEPLVQGASGMRMCRPSFLKEVFRKLKSKNILVIFDEVMTGFGRTGSMFALDQLEVVPDFLCLSKGITGGVLPLALTVTNQSIYEGFLSDDFRKAFAHGHSYTANPLACRAAVTSLKLLQSEACKKSMNDICLAHQKGLAFLKENASDRVEHLRCLGTISAFDLKNLNNKLPLIRNEFLKNGLLIRPLGKVVYMVPPYCLSTEELLFSYEKIANIICGFKLENEENDFNAIETPVENLT
jgi:adenosylmethionine-8-amino-7-oxononanoate aminotransferase